MGIQGDVAARNVFSKEGSECRNKVNSIKEANHETVMFWKGAVLATVYDIVGVSMVDMGTTTLALSYSSTFTSLSHSMASNPFSSYII